MKDRHMAMKPSPHLDPVLAEIVRATHDLPTTMSGSVEAARSRLSQRLAEAPDLGVREMVGHTDHSVAIIGDRCVGVRITRPLGDDARLIAVFAHAGGYALGSAELFDDTARRLCLGLGAIVVSVDYRLTPENSIDEAVDDVVLAAQWAAREPSLRGASNIPVVIVGESAGANLAASASIILDDLAAQLLIVPSPDLTSYANLTDVEGSMLPLEDLSAILQHAFGESLEGVDRFPASAPHGRVEGSPATIIGIAGVHPTATVARTHAGALRAHGIPVQVFEFDSLFHPFLGFVHLSGAASNALDALCEATLDDLKGATS